MVTLEKENQRSYGLTLDDLGILKSRNYQVELMRKCIAYVLETWINPDLEGRKKAGRINDSFKYRSALVLKPKDGSVKVFFDDECGLEIIKPLVSADADLSSRPLFRFRFKRPEDQGLPYALIYRDFFSAHPLIFPESLKDEILRAKDKKIQDLEAKDKRPVKMMRPVPVDKEIHPLLPEFLPDKLPAKNLLVHKKIEETGETLIEYQRGSFKLTWLIPAGVDPKGIPYLGKLIKKVYLTSYDFALNQGTMEPRIQSYNQMVLWDPEPKGADWANWESAWITLGYLTIRRTDPNGKGYEIFHPFSGLRIRKGKGGFVEPAFNPKYHQALLNMIEDKPAEEIPAYIPTPPIDDSPNVLVTRLRHSLRRYSTGKKPRLEPYPSLLKTVFTNSKWLGQNLSLLKAKGPTWMIETLCRSLEKVRSLETSDQHGLESWFFLCDSPDLRTLAQDPIIGPSKLFLKLCFKNQDGSFKIYNLLGFKKQLETIRSDPQILRARPKIKKLLRYLFSAKTLLKDWRIALRFRGREGKDLVDQRESVQDLGLE